MSTGTWRAVAGQNAASRAATALQAMRQMGALEQLMLAPCMLWRVKCCSLARLERCRLCCSRRGLQVMLTYTTRSRV